MCTFFDDDDFQKAYLEDEEDNEGLSPINQFFFVCKSNKTEGISDSEISSFKYKLSVNLDLIMQKKTTMTDIAGEIYDNDPYKKTIWYAVLVNLSLDKLEMSNKSRKERNNVKWFFHSLRTVMNYCNRINCTFYLLAKTSKPDNKLCVLYVNNGKTVFSEDEYDNLRNLLCDYMKKPHSNIDINSNDISETIETNFGNSVKKSSRNLIEGIISQTIAIRPNFLKEPLPVLANALPHCTIRVEDANNMKTYKTYLPEDNVDDSPKVLEKHILGYYCNNSGSSEIVLCPDLIKESADTMQIDIDNSKMEKSLFTKVFIHELAHLLLDSTIECVHYEGCAYKHQNFTLNRTELRAIEESLANYLCLWYISNIYGTDSDEFKVADTFIRECQPLMYKFGKEQYLQEVDWTKWVETKRSNGMILSDSFIEKAHAWYNDFVVAGKTYTKEDYNQLFKE